MSPEAGNERLMHIRRAVADRFAGHPDALLQSIGMGKDSVKISLKAAARSIAEEINREFGSAVEITLGFKSFPEGSSSGPSPQLSESRGSLRAIHATCEVEAARLLVGNVVSGKVVIQNSGHSDIAGFGSVSVGWLCRPGTLQVVGGYSGSIASVRRVIRIDSGDNAAFNFVVGTASCERGPRYVVQPGRYEVVVPVDLEIEGAQGAVRILARDCFIEIYDADDGAQMSLNPE